MNRELKPCPFCGGEAKLDWGSAYNTSEGLRQEGWVECRSCDASVEMFSIDENYSSDDLAKKWNTRVEQEQVTQKQILESCIDIKGQKVVSLSRLAEVLGVDMLTKEQIGKLVDGRKALQLKESK